MYAICLPSGDQVCDQSVAPFGVSIVFVAFVRGSTRMSPRRWLVVTVNLRLRDLKQNTVLFQQDDVREQADFRVQDAVSQTISREETALRAAATEIGRAIVSLTVTRF